MLTERRWSGQELKILGLFMRSPADKLHGYAVLRETGFQSGIVYTILARLAARGVLTVEHERVAPTSPRSPRTFYRISPAGLTEFETIRGLVMSSS